MGVCLVKIAIGSRDILGAVLLLTPVPSKNVLAHVVPLLKAVELRVRLYFLPH